jgi:hypothetical protein
MRVPPRLGHESGDVITFYASGERGHDVAQIGHGPPPEQAARAEDRVRDRSAFAIIEKPHQCDVMIDEVCTCSAYDVESFLHPETRGCLFDFCQQKPELEIKLQAGHICAECTERLLRARIEQRDHEAQPKTYMPSPCVISPDLSEASSGAPSSTTAMLLGLPPAGWNTSRVRSRGPCDAGFELVRDVHGLRGA